MMSSCNEMSNQFESLNNVSEHQIEADSSPGSATQARKQRVPRTVVSCSEFGGLMQEILKFLHEGFIVK